MTREQRPADDAEPRTNARPQPDDAAEGTDTRGPNQGGFQPRLFGDQDEPPLAEQMADQMNLRKDWQRRRKPQQKPRRS